MPSYFQSLEHLLRYCARPPFALERLSVIRDADGRIIRIRYVLPRHKAANWVGPGRGRKSTRPDATGIVALTPFEFLDRLANLVPPPRKHRHRYHGVFAPNHKLRRAVGIEDSLFTSMQFNRLVRAVGNAVLELDPVIRHAMRTGEVDMKPLADIHADTEEPSRLQDLAA